MTFLPIEKWDRLSLLKFNRDQLLDIAHHYAVTGTGNTQVSVTDALLEHKTMIKGNRKIQNFFTTAPVAANRPPLQETNVNPQQQKEQQPNPRQKIVPHTTPASTVHNKNKKNEKTQTLEHKPNNHQMDIENQKPTQGTEGTMQEIVASKAQEQKTTTQSVEPDTSPDHSALRASFNNLRQLWSANASIPVKLAIIQRIYALDEETLVRLLGEGTILGCSIAQAQDDQVVDALLRLFFDTFPDPYKRKHASPIVFASENLGFPTQELIWLAAKATSYDTFQPEALAFIRDSKSPSVTQSLAVPASNTANSPFTNSNSSPSTKRPLFTSDSDDEEESRTALKFKRSKFVLVINDDNDEDMDVDVVENTGAMDVEVEAREVIEISDSEDDM